MKAIILGCGTSTGVPMVGCRCAVCSSTERRDKRTRASLLVRCGERNILVDTSTDLRRQAIREHIERIDAVLFTHPHADHINGIDDLRGFHFIHRQVVPCYATAETMGVVTSHFSYIFDGAERDGYVPLLEPHVIDGPFDLFGCAVIPVPLVHGNVNACGYRFGGLAYLTDCSAVPPRSMALLQGLDTLVIDGLRYTPHFTHFNIEGALKVIEELRPRRAVLTHLTHEVPYSDRVKLPPGVELAYDGMVLE